jgi:NitT/TauT family transport system ATP-binding protein
MAASGVVVQDLQKVFRQRSTGELITAIEQLDFTIEPGEIVSVVGRTGCGKSTFLAILLGLERPSGGSVLVDGKQPYRDFADFEGRIACVFQQDRLLPWRSVLDNVKLTLEILHLPPREQEAQAREWLERVGLGNVLAAYPHELSGGMRQRAAMARAFVAKPQLLLADEAFGHLDEVTAANLRSGFLDLARTSGTTVISITHQLEEALDFGNRVLVFGRPARLLADLRYETLDREEVPILRRQIQTMIDTDQPLATSEVA